MNETNEELEKENLWLLDSCSSIYLTNILKGMMNLRMATTTLNDINVGKSSIEYFGDFHCTYIDENNKTIQIKFEEVGYTENANNKLISQTRSLSNGMKLTNIREKQIIFKDDVKLTFDKVIRTSTGYVGGINLRPIHYAEEEFGMLSLDVNAYHRKLEHVCEKHTRLTAHMNSVDLKGSFESYEDCGPGKIEQKK